MPLPGGEAAIREPWRVAAASTSSAAGLPVPLARWPVVRESLKLDPPLSSGMGRLFDAVAALLGVREQVSYEGQAAIELEQLAGDTRGRAVSDGASATRPGSWRRVTTSSPRAGRARRSRPPSTRRSPPRAAAACVEAGEPRTVVLSGGTFQNLRLLDSTAARGSRRTASACSPTGACRRTTAA